MSKGGGLKSWAIHFFNQLSNLRNLVPLNGSKKEENLFRLALNWLFFQEKLTKIALLQAAPPPEFHGLRRLRLHPQTPVCGTCE